MLIEFVKKEEEKRYDGFFLMRMLIDFVKKEGEKIFDVVFFNEKVLK